MTAPLLARYRLGHAVHYGWLEGDVLRRLDAPPWDEGGATGASDALSDAALLAPCSPSKIICVGLNYVEHVRESLSVAGDRREPPAQPMLFLKPPSAVLDPGGTVRYPAGLERLDPEGEMAMVIGRRCRAVSEHEALHCVAGVTAFDDISARDWQRGDGQWARAKGHDTFAPLGPVIAMGLDPRDLALELRVNGERRQHARTSQMHFGPAFLVHYISRHFTLEPGDLIATGTPAGIAPVLPGDRIEVEIEGVGVLVHHVGPREEA